VENFLEKPLGSIAKKSRKNWINANKGTSSFKV
jgi:hypothetical protein